MNNIKYVNQEGKKLVIKIGQPGYGAVSRRTSRSRPTMQEADNIAAINGFTRAGKRWGK